MSPRAACRLEQLGFTDVYDFVHGKSFWLGSGLPTDGHDATKPRVGGAVEHSIPVCVLGETVADARRRVAYSDSWNQCIVTDHDSIVAGRLRDEALHTADDTPVDEVMEPGPTTVRPDADLDDLQQRMQQRHVGAVLVTVPTGRLIGAYHPS